MNDTISPYKTIDYIRDNAEAYAIAKWNLGNRGIYD